MRHWVGSCTVVMAAVALGVWSMGCRTSSHTSIHISEYDENPPPEITQGHEQETEWQMESPGEMESPGTMIFDPE